MTTANTSVNCHLPHIIGVDFLLEKHYVLTFSPFNFLLSNTHAGAYGLQEQNESSELKNAASPTRSEIKATLNVVNHVFCQSCLRDRVQEDQNTLKEIHTYAELKHDPHASLPSSFTICSTSMTPYVER